MKSWIAAATLVALTPTLAMSQEFDWKAQLGVGLQQFETALGSTAHCDRSGFAIPVRRVNPSTVVDPDLYDPLRTTDFKYSFSTVGQPNLNIDEDENRYFPVPSIQKTTCLIDKEATVTATAFEDKIFRIAMRFDRCQSREKHVSELFKNVYGEKLETRRCSGVDLLEKSFDESLYKQLKARNLYSADRENLIGNTKDDHQRRALSSFSCRLPDDAERSLSRVDDQYRCLFDVDSTDRRKWSALAMYEFYKPGFISYFDEPSRHLAANRLFIDLVAEATVIETVQPGVQKMVDDIKAKIASRVAEKDTKEGTVSNILGAGN